MNEAKARALFETACQAVGAGVPPPKNWKRLGEKTFLSVYCGVIFASNFKARIVDANFPDMKKVFQQFDLTALARMEAGPTVKKLPIKNLRKTTLFLDGAKRILHKEGGWQRFKKRIEKKRGKKEKLEVLRELPGIGHVTKYHLAKDIGLVDTAKPDIQLRRCAEECSTDVCTLVSFLSEEYHKTKYEVDMILFRYKSGYRISK